MIQDSQYINKGRILDRMRRFAANLFGISHTELLDPVVNLFLESLSEEIFKISSEVDNIENRILNKLSSILVPAIETITQPAHCILHTAAQESIVNVSTQDGFRYIDNSQKQDFAFYPAYNTTVYNGNVAFFIHQESVYTIDRDLSKTLYFRSHQRSLSQENTFWIGLDLDIDIDNIAGMSFYFDLNGVPDKSKYLSLLPYTIWSIGDKKLSINRGGAATPEEYDNITMRLFSHYDLSSKINESVENFYRHCFLHLTSDCPVQQAKEKFPKELLTHFPENKINSIDKPLIWIKVTCPENIPTDIIGLLQISINAFPVINKERISKITSIKKNIPIIPLNTNNNESFISVCKVSDSEGREYYDVPLADTETRQYGIYSLRRGGIEHYNRRDAREYLVNVVDSLNKEASSFFKDKDSIKHELRRIETQINRLIRQLNKRLSDTKNRYEIENYLLFNPDKENEVYFVDYWITNGVDANHIRPGVHLSMLSDLSLRPSSIYSLSRTTGGKYAPQASEKDQLYKKNIMEHSLLITDDDIQNFCLQEFKESICDVKVSKGFMESNDPKLGFVETTDVYLKPIEGMGSYINDRDRIYYQTSLEEKSPATFNYRIFINEILSN
ncbi:MAG: hypothetical protein E6772_16895 [Dysgonomonas sp.]|nr:hypothetical protein [Dysgonomonas sp.]